MNPRSQVPASEVEKAEAIAGFAAGQIARQKGYDVKAMQALAKIGQTTQVGPLVLKPHGLQVQLCLIEHAQLFAAHSAKIAAENEGAKLLNLGLQRLTHMALIYTDPVCAFEILTDLGMPEEDRRRVFSNEAFRLAEHFETAENITLLSAHILAQSGLLNEPQEDQAPGK